jgi:hypothetical protein
MADLIDISDLPLSIQGRPDAARLISAASAMAESYCRRPLSIQIDRVEKHDGGAWPEIFLQCTPIMSIDSIFVNGYEITNFVHDSETGRVRRGTGQGSPNFAPWFPEGAGNIVVTYTGGYLTIPDDIKQAVVTAVVNMGRDFDRDPMMQSESFAGQYSYSRAGSGTQGSAGVLSGGRFAIFGRSGLAILAQYRRPGKYVIG